MSVNLKNAIQRARQRKAAAGNANDIRAFMGEQAAQHAEELFSELMDEMRTMGLKELRKVAASIKKGDKGDPGKQGNPGINGKNGKSIVGPPGKQGKPGIGIKGDKGDTGKDGTEIKTNDLLKKLNTAEGGLKITTVSGLEAWLKNLQRAIRESVKSGNKTRKGGAGMTIDAGSNITLVRNSNGRWTITATSGGGSAISTEKVNAVNSGTDVTIDLTQLANTSTGVLFVTRSGQMLLPNGNANLPGSTWSQTGTVVTVYNADAGDGYLIQYSHA